MRRLNAFNKDTRLMKVDKIIEEERAIEWTYQYNITQVR